MSLLDRIDGRGYPAYKELRGRYAFERCELCIDHVQGDPFAAPSKLRVFVPMQVAALPEEWIETPVRRIALADRLAREARARLDRASGEREGSGRSGTVFVDAGGQEVLERTAVRIDREGVELRLEAGLPARGRRILGDAARRLLIETIPSAALRALCFEHLDAAEVRDFLLCVENQEHVRGRLSELGLVAFVGDGARLPRESGASDRPLDSEAAIPFESPESLRVRIEVPNPVDGTRALTGMGIPAGVTLIVGGGYHGKSTLLRAIERGVHPHVPGDGRDRVVSDPALVKIRAEDGRRVERVDIRGFIDALPSGADTGAFSTEDASGSTSQAASIVEALEAGASGLLLDEDTSATNFMVRDARMQALVRSEDEPITPFVDRVRELYERRGVSTLLVMGGSGDYFDVADLVIGMRDYRPSVLTDRAREIAKGLQTGRRPEAHGPLRDPQPRVPDAGSFDPSRGRRQARIDAPQRDRIVFGREEIDLRAVEQIVDRSQTRAIGQAIHLASRRLMDEGVPLPDVLDRLEDLLDREGLEALDPFATRDGPRRHPGNFARPRRFEIAAAINRLRSLRIG